MPRSADLAPGVAGVEQTEQLRAGAVVEALVGHGQQAPRSVEGVGLVAPVAEGVVLHSAADFVEALVGQLHHVEGVRDLGGVGQHRVERQAPRPRQVQHRPRDGIEPGLGLIAEPRTQPRRGAAGDHVEELPGGDIDDLRGPPLGAPAAEAGEEDLVDTERLHRPDPIDISGQQRSPVGDDGVVDGVPVRPQISRNLADGAASAADLDRRPTPGPIGDRQPRGGDAVVFVGLGGDPAPPPPATPAMLAPPQRHRPPEAREIDELDHGAVLDPRPFPTAPTRRGGDPGLDGDLEAPDQGLDDVEDVHLGQTYQQLDRARSVQHSRGSPDSDWLQTPSESQDPCYAPGTPPRSSAKRRFTATEPAR